MYGFRAGVNLLGKTYHGPKFCVVDMRAVSGTTLESNIWSNIVLRAVASSRYLLKEFDF